ncbi:amidohydrolase family protein [Aestuariivivens insulae]|uniref:hypothetical protein n=1 Tax=Aestuariivivens insulae TaxID=1621988 RepID=UPI001F56F0A9|nr:hypothetical protein [Aestuariivivens insulae]
MEKHFTKPIVNSHTHIFISDDVPRYLAKKILVWPFYYLIHTHIAVSISRWYRERKKKHFTFTHKNKTWQKYLSNKSPIKRFFNRVFLLVINVIFFFYVIYIFQNQLAFGPLKEPIKRFYDHDRVQQFLFLPERFHYLGIVLVLFVCFKNIRNKCLKFIWGQIEKRFGKEWLALKLRYLNLLRYARYTRMSGIFHRMKDQYPRGSKFVVLPMDMEYMGAGQVKRSYPYQMSRLLKIKKSNEDTIFPFVFAHPKRMDQKVTVEVDGTSIAVPYFSGYLDEEGYYQLNECAIKLYLENGCAGIKIYPATGYYVFDEKLLPLWLYCAQKNIPITTHCSVGPIFYRGNLSKLDGKIDEHPIFKQNTGQLVNGQYPQLRLPLHKNSIFQKNFTHPLNYCCLLEDKLLKEVLDYHNNSKLNTLFGYTDKKKPLKRNLSNLKINLAHYGGSENWDQFLEQDRFVYANWVVKKPNSILNLRQQIFNVDVFYKYWHYVDWFTIISSMMVNYDNVYTDVSYTTHDLKHLNLLSEILDHSKIRKRVMFGTDFYVVSNHKSEKHYWMDMESNLSARKWNLLSDGNPKEFLNSKYVNIT